jgi:hypothetical protein
MSGIRPGTARMVALLFALLLVGKAGAALAACTQADATGRWMVYGFAYQRGYEPYWTKCEIVIGSNGMLTGASNCQNSLGQGGTVSGKISLSSGPTCQFTGAIVLSGC